MEMNVFIPIWSATYGYVRIRNFANSTTTLPRFYVSVSECECVCVYVSACFVKPNQYLNNATQSPAGIVHIGVGLFSGVRHLVYARSGIIHMHTSFNALQH